MLGWTQVDFPPKVQEQIRAINIFEQQQANFSNRGADLQWKIDGLQSQREQDRKAHGEHLVQLKSEMQPLLELRNRSKAPLAEKQASLRRFERAISDLEAAHQAFGAKLHELMAVEPPTLEIRRQITSINDQRAAFESERDDLDRSRLRVSHEVKTIRETIAGHDLEISRLNRKIEKAGDAFTARDGELLSQIHKLEREKAETEKHVAALDQKKSPAYLAIGRCLADFNIGPINQPDALQRVAQHRQTIRNCEQRIADSRAESSKISRESWLLFCAAVILVLVTVVFSGAFFFNVHWRN